MIVSYDDLYDFFLLNDQKKYRSWNLGNSSFVYFRAEY